MCLLLLGRSVPCKTGYIKKCLPVSGTVFTKLSNTSVVIGLPKQTSAIVFRDRDIFAHSSIVSSRTLSGTGLIAVLGSSFSQLTDWSLERQRENRQCMLALYLKLFVFVLSLLLTWSLQKPPAIVASYFGNLSALRKLIQCGADIALVSSTGFNCLDAAIKSGNTDVCMELVKNKKYES